MRQLGMCPPALVVHAPVRDLRRPKEHLMPLLLLLLLLATDTAAAGALGSRPWRRMQMLLLLLLLGACAAVGVVQGRVAHALLLRDDVARGHDVLQQVRLPRGVQPLVAADAPHRLLHDTGVAAADVSSRIGMAQWPPDLQD